jgi:starch synthase
MFLMPSKSEPCGLAQMVALRYGSIPIVRETGGLKDTITEGKAGNGFTFAPYHALSLRDACFRAQKAYQDKAGWKALIRRAMLCDHGWGEPSKNYLALYHEIMKLW